MGAFVESQSVIKNELIPVVVIVGPTAVGKSNLALMVARNFSGEIVSADSAQVYRGLDVGTAKPSRQERDEIRHHLIDIVSPAEQFSVAEFQRQADEVIPDIYQRGKLPILCGGTGFYINAVTDRYAFTERGKNEEIREELAEKAAAYGSQYLHDKLNEVDPDAAQKIHHRDQKRLIRALEVYYTEGRPISMQVKETRQQASRYQLLLIGLNMQRDELYQKINSRTEQMMANGFLEEVEGLLEKYTPESPGLQVLGYRQIVSYLQQKRQTQKTNCSACTEATTFTAYEETVESIKKATRNYAKKQLTWFRRDNRIQWFEVQETDYHVFEKNIAGFLQECESNKRKEY